MAVSWEDVVAIATAFPEVEESTSFGTPSLKVRKKLIARLRTEKASPYQLMLRCDAEQKDFLLQTGDSTFGTEPHYDGYPAILIRLDLIDRDHLADLVEDAWRIQAPVRVRKAWDADHPRMENAQ
ncbi:MAG TPA: MmcQ/YjbR family DNA-binding protein [Thermomicrobiales bacterium]|nr:MmcQ/YjbR family DNA-binding protein [Thermomicrobiales bacterium]